MNNKDVLLRISSNIGEKNIHMSIPNNYGYKMDGKILMVGEDKENVNMMGYFYYLFKKYEEINEDIIQSNNNMEEETYNYRRENIGNKEFKTYCIKYKSDLTVNKVYICKINEDIVGQVEIQYAGAKTDEEYTIERIAPFLSMLVNIKIENIELQNENINNQNESVPANPDEIFTILKKNSTTMNMLLIISAVMLLFGIIVDILVIKHIVITIIAGIWVVIFMMIFLTKFLIGKKNLKEVNFGELRSEILNNCISFKKSKTFFTNNNIISNHYHPSVIKYSDIIWMYPLNKNYNGVPIGKDLIICLKNKKKETLNYDDKFVNIILNHNSNIIFGFSLENKQKYNEIIKNKN